MKTVVITDGRYRTSIAAARMLARAGYRIAVTQTRGDESNTPPVFSSKYVSQVQWFSGRVSDEGYAEQLIAFLGTLDRPVLFPIGAVTLNLIAENLERFQAVADFVISPKSVLDALNDKEQVHSRCTKLGIPVPKQYAGQPDAYPVVIKPHCGEKVGLKARNRYVIAHDHAEFETDYALMKRYDDAPIVQQQITDDGFGASLLLDQEGRLISAICHHRIREYPITGGPSTCCESIYDQARVETAYRLLHSFGFVGMAMVEFKGEFVLEVNPRVWGSFSMTEAAASPFACHYAMAAAGAQVEYVPNDYGANVRMRFLLNDTVAMLSLLRHGKLGAFGRGVRDVFCAREALSDREDKKPMQTYLKNALKR